MTPEEIAAAKLAADQAAANPLMAQILAKIDSGQKDAKAVQDKVKADIAANGVISTETRAEVQKVGADLAAQQLAYSALELKLNGFAEQIVEMQGRGAAAVVLQKASQSFGQSFVESDEYKFFAENWKGPGGKCKCAPEMKNPLGAGMQTKAPQGWMGNALNGAGLGAQFQSPRAEENFPTPQPVFRQFCTVIPPGAASSVRTRLNTGRYQLFTTLTADAGLAATSLLVANIAGFSASAANGRNVINLSDGTNEDSVTISAIVAAAPDDPADNSGTLTVSATGFAFTKALTSVTADNFEPTTEGTYKPQGLNIWEEKLLNFDKVASWEEASDELLADSNIAKDIIDRTLMGNLAQEEDRIVAYGDGEFTGVFVSTSVVEFLWSNAAAASTKIDFLLDLIFVPRYSNFVTSAIFISPQDGKDIVKTKGQDLHYVLKEGPESVSTPFRIFAVPVIMTNTLRAGDAIVGDMARAIAMYPRSEIQMKIGQPGDRFFRNMNAIMGEYRLAGLIDVPNAIVRAKFDSQP